MLQSVAVLLLSTHETSFIREYLQPLDGHENVYRLRQQAEIVTYHIGKYGTCIAAVRKIPPVFKENDNPAAVVMMANQCFPNLGAVISVGVACGIKKKTQICDVLVSTKVINYNYDITMERYLPKGEAVTVSSSVIKLFTQPVHLPNDAVNKYLEVNNQQIPNVKTGVMLSGPYVVDGPAAINKLVKNFGVEVIGIEMDGANLFVKNQEATLNTIIVKAVCDFGDGKNIEINQDTAALLAANLVYTGLSHPQAPEILKGLPIYSYLSVHLRWRYTKIIWIIRAVRF